MIATIVGVLSVATLAGQGCSSDTLESERLDRFRAAEREVAAWIERGELAGAVLLARHYPDPPGPWSRRERLPLEMSSALGHASAFRFDGGRLDEPVPMTAGTIFDLASITKVAATTMSTMALVDRGLVDLDAPVADHLPDFTGGGRERITARHLLTHRSGLAPWWPVYYHAEDPDAAYAFVHRHPLAGIPGAERRYSDLGFMLLGRLVETVSGKPLDRFAFEELYRSLGLRATGFRPLDRGSAWQPNDPRIRPSPADDRPPSAETARSLPVFAATSRGNPFERRMVHDPAFGYRIDLDPLAWNGWREYTLVGEVNDGNGFHAFGVVAGHAGLFSTAGELATLVGLMLTAGRYRDRRFFGSETVREFLEDTGEGQALGWQLPDYAPPASFGHTGFTGTLVLAVPARRMVIVLLTNRQHAGVGADGRYPDIGPLQRKVVEILTDTAAG